MNTFEDARDFHILHILAINSNNTVYSKDYTSVLEKKKTLNRVIDCLPVSECSNLVSNVLRKIWYQWYYTDMTFDTPLTITVRKKIIQSPPIDDGGGPVQFKVFY